MNFPYPASVWWGKDMCLIYNQLYAEVSEGDVLS